MICQNPLIRAALVAALAACTQAPRTGADPESSGDDQASSPSNRVDIPATVRRNLAITFAEVEIRRVAQTIRVPGSFELLPPARHEYRMGLAGHVQLLVDQYERVEPGQPLFRYRSPEWQELVQEILSAEQAIAAAEAEIGLAEAKVSEAERGLELARGRIEALAQAEFKKAGLEAEAAGLEASLPRLAAELQVVRTRLENAKLSRELALHRASDAAGIPEAELEATYRSIDWLVVSAEQGGVVETLGVTGGAYALPATTVLSTVDPSKVRFRAMALQADLSKFTSTTEARIVPPQSPEVPAGEGVGATMTIGLEASPTQRTVTLLATPGETAEWIRPGVSAFLEVVVASTEAPSLAVPQSAVVRDGLSHVLFRRDPADPNKAIRIEADMGTSDGRWVVLNSGVVKGDEVVLAGAYELKLATQQSAGAQVGGHFHADGSYHGDRWCPRTGVPWHLPAHAPRWRRHTFSG